MTIPVPSVRILILALCVIHICATHSYSADFVIRPPGDSIRRDDFNLQIVSNFGTYRWSIQYGYFRWFADLQLKCYLVLYKGRSSETVHMRDIRLKYGEDVPLAFYVKPGVYSRFHVQCDYWNPETSALARRAGIIFFKGHKDPRTCLESNSGCLINFINGAVYRTYHGVSTFIGEVPHEKCATVSLGRWFCKEIKHTRPMFGSDCVNKCGFR